MATCSRGQDAVETAAVMAAELGSLARQQRTTAILLEQEEQRGARLAAAQAGPHSLGTLFVPCTLCVPFCLAGSVIPGSAYEAPVRVYLFTCLK